MLRSSPLSVWLLALVILLIPRGKVHCWTVSQETTLRTTLMTSYSADVRPSSKTSLSLNLIPLSLNDLDITNQLMSFTNLYMFTWTDSRLSWTPATHGNIDSVTFTAEQIWTPNIVVENAISDVGQIGGNMKDGTPLRVTSGGEVMWYPPIETSTSCDMNIKRFPFDEQACTIVLTAWGLTDQEQEVSSSTVSLHYYSPNGEWDMQESSTSDGFFCTTIGNFTRTNLNFRFRRNWPFYGLNLIMPIVLTSVMIVFVFAVPLESGEKIGYALTVLLSYVVFLAWLTDNLPSTSSDTSVLQVYIAVVLCCGILATLLTLWILTVYYRDADVPYSAPMRLFVRFLLAPLYTRRCGGRKTPVTSLDQGEGSKLAFVEKPPVDKQPQAEKAHAQESNAPEAEKYTWQEVAVMLDYFFLVMFGMVKIILTLVSILLLYGDYM